MNHLIAKIKRKREYLRVLSSELEIYSIPEDIGNRVEYSPTYKLEENEWFVLNEFTEKNFSIELLTRTFLSTDYAQITISDYNNIAFLCSIQNNHYFFQKISESYFVRKNSFLFQMNPK